MKSWTALALAGWAVTNVVATACVPHVLVQSQRLQDKVSVDNVFRHLQLWESFAYSYPERNRFVGTLAHNKTLDYIVEQLETLGDYYEIVRQPWNTTIQVFSEGSLKVNSVAVPANPMDNTKNGTFAGLPLVWVNSYGCNGTSDFPPAVKGAIALISRGPTGGNCAFATKSAHAGLAGAAGLVVYDNIAEDSFGGTLGEGEPPMGPTIPTLSILNREGLALVERIKGGETLTADFVTAAAFSQVYSSNVIATTTRGDPDNILFLGAHSDSVEDGPGINDNGSGSAGILEVALRLGRYLTSNKVRFAWWTAEEEGLLGSEYYVATLPAEEQMKIRLYLNFDMIASGNGVCARYDGDGSAFNQSGPAGSDVAEHLFESYFASKGKPLTTSEFNGRSDYGPFLAVNVPCGGLDTGAEKKKTEEEAAIFGGTAGVAYDPNYHGPGDTALNMSIPFLEVNSKAIAHAVATYGVSWEGFPARTAPEPERRWLAPGRPTRTFRKGVWIETS